MDAMRYSIKKFMCFSNTTEGLNSLSTITQSKNSFAAYMKILSDYFKARNLSNNPIGIFKLNITFSILFFQVTLLFLLHIIY